MSGTDWIVYRFCLCLVAGMLAAIPGRDPGPQAATDPGAPGPCEVSNRTVQVDGDLETHIYYPQDDRCGNSITAPYPGIGFAHGFSLFGLTNGAADNAGTGEHLASWGYVVAIPVLPDDFESRIADLQAVLSYLEAQTDTPASFLYRKVDTGRLAVTGHSLGGTTALALAARDSRVKAVAALDPVYHQGGPGGNPALWDPALEGPHVAVPTCILGAPPSNCNSEGDHARIYPFVGAAHKTSFLVVEASHCDFMDPGQPLCTLVCTGDTDPQRTRLIQKTTTAWFNYYLHLNTDAYTYLYGAHAQTDIDSGRIERQVDTAPKGLTTVGMADAIALGWERYEHPIVAGYNIYRRLPGETYAETPQAQVGPTSTYLDVGLQPGQTYSYTLRSRDNAGNRHQPSGEVSAVPTGSVTCMSVYLPIILRTR
jgi:dienelactone hydrolase